MKARSFLKSSVICAAFLCLSTFLKAEPGDGGGDPDPGGPAPLDLGISVLVAAGIGYAAKKRYDLRKKETIADNKNK